MQENTHSICAIGNIGCVIIILIKIIITLLSISHWDNNVWMPAKSDEMRNKMLDVLRPDTPARGVVPPRPQMDLPPKTALRPSFRFISFYFPSLHFLNTNLIKEEPKSIRPDVHAQPPFLPFSRANRAPNPIYGNVVGHSFWAIKCNRKLGEFIHLFGT
jgi:hypothetical protein